MGKSLTFAHFADINPHVALDKNIEYPFVEMADITPGQRYVKAAANRQYTGGGSRFSAGDVLFARITPCLENGKIAQFKSMGDTAFGSTEFIVFRNIQGISDQSFIYYLANSDLVRKPAEKSMSGASGRQRADLSTIKNIEIPEINLPAQRKIATILSAYDDLIENNQRRIKILEEMAQMLYREWFIKFRFPGYEKVQMIDSSLGMIPEGWEVKKLSSLVETQYGYTESASEIEIGPKFVRGMDINKTSYIEWYSVPYCNISNDNLEKYKLSVGDILIIRMADPGKVGIIEKDVNAIFASYLVRLHITSSRLYPYYLFYFLNSDYYQGYINGASTGTTRKSASAGVIVDIEMLVPTRDVCENFEKHTNAIRTMLNNKLEQNSNLRRTRDLLLPKLISGEIDVSDLDIKGEEAT